MKIFWGVLCAFYGSQILSDYIFKCLKASLCLHKRERRTTGIGLLMTLEQTQSLLDFHGFLHQPPSQAPAPFFP